MRLCRRSDFRPQRIMGVVGQKCRTSGYHWKSISQHAKPCRCRTAYLVEHILERIGAVDREAYEQQVSFGVRKRPQSVIFLLTSGVPQRELNTFA